MKDDTVHTKVHTARTAACCRQSYRGEHPAVNMTEILHKQSETAREASTDIFMAADSRGDHLQHGRVCRHRTCGPRTVLTVQPHSERVDFFHNALVQRVLAVTRAVDAQYDSVQS